MKREVSPNQKETTANLKEQSADAGLTPQKLIMERLIQEGLRGPRDEFDDHLLPQLEAIKSRLYILDNDRAIDILTLGYYIDTELQNGAGIGEVTLSIADELTDIAEAVLRKDTPSASRDAAELVVGRAIDLYDPSKFFIDVFITAIEERRIIMKGIPPLTYVVDESTGIVEPKID